MTFLGRSNRNLRSAAWERLALLSAKTASKGPESSFERLIDRAKLGGNSLLKLSQIQVLYALTMSTGTIKDEHQITILLSLFSQYLNNALNFEFPHYLPDKMVEPCALTKLVFELVTAIANLGVNSKSDKASIIIENYIASIDPHSFKGKLCIVGVIQALRKARQIINPKIFNLISGIFVNDFYNEIEKIESSMENDDDLQVFSSFAYYGIEFDCLFFIELVSLFQLEYMKNITGANTDSLMDYMLKGDFIIESGNEEAIKRAVTSQLDIENYIKNAPEQVHSEERRIVFFRIKALSFQIFALAYSKSLIEYEQVNSRIVQSATVFMNGLDNSSTEPFEMLKSDLFFISCGTAAILSESDSESGLLIIKAYPKILKSLIMDKEYTKRMSVAITSCLKSLTQEDTTNLIYELSNMLIDTSTTSESLNGNENDNITDFSSVIHVDGNDLITQNVITSILEVAKATGDPSVNTLVCTLLSQKLTNKNNEFNAILLDGLIEFIDNMTKKNFEQVMKSFYVASISSPGVSVTRVSLWRRFSQAMRKRHDSELYVTYLERMLTQIIAKGDMDNLEHHRPDRSVSAVAHEIGLFLGPLADALPDTNQKSKIPKTKEIVRLFQNLWFNLAIHGFAYNSEIVKKFGADLKRIAHSSPPLASEATWNRSETSIEMNTILRRGTSKTTEKLHKETLRKYNIPNDKLSRPGLMFLSSALLLEGLRVSCGNCSTILEYLSDPSVTIAKLESQVSVIAQFCFQFYLQKIKTGGDCIFTTKAMGKQLERLFVFCCHRESALQDCAFNCADYLLKYIPTALCYQKSAFALLDVLTLLSQSIIDVYTNEYDPMTTFEAPVTGIVLSLSDSYKWRQHTLDRFNEYATSWVVSALTASEYDMKTTLKEYIAIDHKSQNYAVSFALDMASKILPSDREFWQLQSNISKLKTTAGFLNGSMNLNTIKYNFDNKNIVILRAQHLVNEVSKSNNKEKFYGEYQIIMQDLLRVGKIKELVEIPFLFFDSFTMEHAINIWLSAMKNPENSSKTVAFILQQFELTILHGRGLFNCKFDLKNPKFNPMEYLPSNKDEVDHQSKLASKLFKPHLLLIRFLSSHFKAVMYESDHLLKMFTECIIVALKGLESASTHPYSRMIRFELIQFGWFIRSHHEYLKSSGRLSLTEALLNGALSWFKTPMIVPFGNNRLKVKADLEILKIIRDLFSKSNIGNTAKNVLIKVFLEDEISLLNTWLDPLIDNKSVLPIIDEKLISAAYEIDGKLAVNLVRRAQHSCDSTSGIERQLKKEIINNPYKVTDLPEAALQIVDNGDISIAVWAPAAPVDAIKFFMPPFNKNAIVLQYAMRSIESFDIHLTFFYVPQIVQTMRHDELGYIRRFILETAEVSQLFAHQIIWNMAANSFKDEDSEIPDDIKPALDDIKLNMIKSFSGDNKSYFEKEFRFFDEVTGISGKLKPFIKKSKPEKKAKIDEEMSKILVEEGVYLPSNPDGTVVDIDRKSGKPLQSHAKAPFLATFMIKKPKLNEEESFEIVKTSAIFKVGDDCRQDVLALQLISMFRTIWMTAGVDVYVFPYRVTATAPGCGIIDVLPNSISRDMLGREAVNGLYEYFITQFGPESGVQFQKARNNFVKSLAAYSIITYLLAIKDRHNGNIMYDNEGHILHIDFGFCFDIVPGGVKFEQSPFKLTREMVRVMGGNTNTQAYKWFEELCVKCFLACRLHMDAIIDMVRPMMESGLPCFKAKSIEHLKARFAPGKSEMEAATYIRGLIKKSFESFATKGYDEFQRITNGIPY